MRVLEVESAHLAEYENLQCSTARLWDTFTLETFSQRLPDCPYLCDDGLLWKLVERERVVDVTEIPLEPGDDEWLQSEVFVVADECFYCVGPKGN